MKHLSCGFCQGLALPGNTFVDNGFLRNLETAGKFPTEISRGNANYVRRKPFGQNGRRSPARV